MKPTVVMDIECYTNFFLVGFRNVKTGNTRVFKCFGERACLPDADIKFIRGVLSTMRIVTFNGRNYDIPMLTYALCRASCADLKACSDSIIVDGLKFWDIERKYGIKVPRAENGDIDHWDLIDVAFGQASLKIYGGRIHSRVMRDLPFDPAKILTPADAVELEAYWSNDMQTTIDLYNELLPDLELRQKMTAQYGIDLMSKSDAQIAEAIIKKGVEEARGQKVFKPNSRVGDWFNYKAPQWLRFQTSQLQNVLAQVLDAKFIIDMNGAVMLPSTLEGLKVTIGSSTYRMGIGGLHSSEEKVAHHADYQFCLVDRDVRSYYPNLILRLGIYPEHLGPEFLVVYKQIVDDRERAKLRAQQLKKEIALIKERIHTLVNE